jgi:O-antigen ligase
MNSLEVRSEKGRKGDLLTPDLLKKVYLLLAISFSFIWLVSNGSTDLLQKFLTVSFLISAFHDKKLRQDSVFLGSLLLIGFFCLEFIWHFLSVPAAIFANRFPIKYINFFCFFLLLAYGTVVWKRVSPFLILIGAAVGLVIFLALYSSLEEWRLSWQGARVEFGFRNAQHAGIFFGTGLLGISFLGHRILRANAGLARVLWVLVVCAFAGMMIYGIIVTQVRAVWIALILAYLAGIVAYVFTTNVDSLIAWLKNIKHVALAMLVISGLLVLGSALDIQERIQQRIGQESISIQTVEEAARFEEKQVTSSGIRIALWAASLQWIEERPLLGWGSYSVAQLIRSDSRFNAEFKHEFGHLHNSALEILVAVGAIGLFSIGGVVVLLAISVLKARRAGFMPKDVFLFAWAFLIFWTIVNCFESYINYSTGFYLNSIVAGFLYAFYLQRPAWIEG